MDLWTHDRARFPLPPRHRFPLAKYSLLRRRVVELGLATPEEIHETEPVAWALLERVHDGDAAAAHPRRRAEPARAARPRAAVVARAGRARPPLGGGHAGGGAPRARARRRDEPRRRHPPRRPRVRPRLLPLQRRRRARSRSCGPRAWWSTRWWSTATSTRATAPPTCSRADPHAYTLSLHGARNYPFQRIPSDLDVDLPTGTGDADYLEALDHALDEALYRRPPEIAFYLAGADPWEGDRLGRLSLTKAGLRARDALVLDRLRAIGADVCVVLAGGYAEDVRDTVEINAGTAAAVAARCVVTPGL